LSDIPWKVIVEAILCACVSVYVVFLLKIYATSWLQSSYSFMENSIVCYVELIENSWV